MTRDIPILCRGHEVRAILEGRQTQMRRALKPQPQEDIGLCLAERPLRWQPGVRLWVKETWCPNALTYGQTALYRADGIHVVNDDDSDRSPWRSSIHMPRSMSRITLLVTDVRVQRLQDISEADARAEGAPPWTGAHQSYVTGFYNIWATINGRDSFYANPWVAAISFERVT